VNNSAPSLLSGKRIGLAALLAALALGEALLAVLLAETIDQLLGGGTSMGWPALPVAAGLIGMAGLALLTERWVGERFAQSFVTDCREALYKAVMRHRGEGNDARWLTGLVNDMAALRNYALRGTVRLWTSILSAGGAAIWVGLTMPELRFALAPLTLGVVCMILLARPLSGAITKQRTQRGRMNRFFVRRVRIAMADLPVTNGHGYRTLANHSEELGDLSVRRAILAGGMTAVIAVSGLMATLIIATEAVASGTVASIAGSLTLIAFVSGRLMETSRALHARIGGGIAMARLGHMLARPAKPRPRSKTKSASPALMPPVTDQAGIKEPFA
jgi:ABC-type multidrug transport system fused ATPase/permease subunit